MLTLKKISKYYHDKQTVVKALDEISLHFERNEFVVITGESGSGKSTLLNVISGLDSYEDGEMLILGKETSYYTAKDWETYRKNHIGFIFQHYNLIESYTVYQNVEIASKIAHPKQEKRHETIMSLIDKVGLKGKEKQKASTLSGGEKQRVAIARALAKDAPLIIADEPTGNLDKETGANILKLLKDISKDKLVLVVSHSYETTKAYATRHVRLFDGEVISDDQKTQTKSTEEPTPPKPSPLAFMDIFRMGLKNLLATPRKTLFTLFVALFVVATFALVYGAYVQQANSGEGGGMFRFYENPNRIMITKIDGSSFSEADQQHFESLQGVVAALPFDNTLDLRTYIRIRHQDFSYFHDGAINHPSVLSASDLSQGRMPENPGEIVALIDDFEVGDTLEISLEVPMRFADDADIKTFEFELVGKVDGQPFPPIIYPHGSFFEDEMFRNFGLFMNQNRIIFSDDANSLTDIGPALTLDQDLTADEITISKYLADQIRASGPDDGLEVGDVITMQFVEKLSDANIEKTFTIQAISEEMANYGVHIALSDAGLSRLFEDHEPYQMSLMVTDRFDANRLIEQLDEEAVHYLYPAGITDPFTQMGQAIMNLFLGFLSLLVLSVMYFIGYLALKNVMEAKRKDYVILRSIGLFKKDLNTLSALEILCIMFLAIFIIFVLLFLNANIYPFLPNYLRYYQWGNYLFMMIMLLGMSILLAMRFNQRIFSKSVITAFKDQG